MARVMAAVRREGHLLITNHNVLEAVILPPEQYDQLVSAAWRRQPSSWRRCGCGSGSACSVCWSRVPMKSWGR